jgi:hypothetical protein
MFIPSNLLRQAETPVLPRLCALPYPETESWTLALNVGRQDGRVRLNNLLSSQEAVDATQQCRSTRWQ